MPPMERKYVKQNIKRLIGHIEDIHRYLIAIGDPYLELGKKISEDTGDWPQEYINVIETVDLGIDMIEQLINLMQALQETI